MKYRVEWSPSALDDLMRIWTDSAQRASVTEASHIIDQELSLDPEIVGEAREGNTRITFSPPLAVLFDINHDLRTVVVWAVWQPFR